MNMFASFSMSLFVDFFPVAIAHNVNGMAKTSIGGKRCNIDQLNVGPSGISVGDPKMLWLGGMKAGGRSDEPKRGPFSRPPGDFSS